MYIKGLVQTPVGPVFDASGAMSLCELCSGDLEGLVLWCPPSLPALPLFLPPLMQHPLSSKRRDLMETSHAEVSLQKTLNFV